MLAFLALLLICLAVLGNAFWWITLVNRLHGTAIGKRPALAITLVCFALVPAIPLAVAVGLARIGLNPLDRADWNRIAWPAWFGLAACWLGGGVALVGWIARRWIAGMPSAVRYYRRRRFEPVPPQWHGKPAHQHHAVMRIPGNEMLQLDLSECGVELPTLPPVLEGLSIVHITDAHFTGWVDRGFFHELVGLANGMDPDLVVLTGDLIDKRKCIDWLPETFGQLRARFGVHFVLGNHDVRVDGSRIRAALTGCGLVDLGGRWVEHTVRGMPVLLIGNETPWGRPAPDLAGAPPPAGVGGPLRIALSHSPDQLGWARRNHVDLMFAGHTHGGQIRFPGIGPILSPSVWGVSYAAGLFHEPPTVLYVSRGVSGQFPIRFLCLPELARIVLHQPGEGEPPSV